MRLAIEGSMNFSIRSEADIARLVPPSHDGKALNYGQGEGQFQVGSTVWGIYVRPSGGYSLQFEEGRCDVRTFCELLSSISAHMQALFGEATVNVEGALEQFAPHEKYT